MNKNIALRVQKEITMKVKMNKKTQEARDFWQHAEKVAQEAEAWPEWKKKVQVSKYPTKDKCTSSAKRKEDE